MVSIGSSVRWVSSHSGRSKNGLDMKFFFKLDSAHRDLHSFPTRRSSDLATRVQIDAQHPAALGPKHLHGQKRSEEHTSELQSRFEVVCRLLLEKTHILGLQVVDTDHGLMRISNYASFRCLHQLTAHGPTA